MNIERNDWLISSEDFIKALPLFLNVNVLVQSEDLLNASFVTICKAYTNLISSDSDYRSG